jgi:hypothetical protein
MFLGFFSHNIGGNWIKGVNFKSSKAELLRDVWLPSLVLPVGTVQPSMILLAVSASFVCAFSLTCCFVGLSPKSQLLQPSSTQSFGVIVTF